MSSVEIKNPDQEVPEHLGGHLNLTNLDEGIIKGLKKSYNIKSILDIGCGTGGMENLCKKYQINWTGIDGDPTVANNENIKIHDFTKGPLSLDQSFDVVWSTEFLEHVEQKYMPNYMPLFQLGKIIVVTAAKPGTPGHHHVNCQPLDYWKNEFKKYDLSHEEDLTFWLKSISTMRKDFYKKTGMVFIKKKKLPIISDFNELNDEWRSDKEPTLENLNKELSKQTLDYERIGEEINKILDYSDNSPKVDYEEREAKIKWFNRLSMFIDFSNSKVKLTLKQRFLKIFSIIINNNYSKDLYEKLNYHSFASLNIKTESLKDLLKNKLSKIKQMLPNDETGKFDRVIELEVKEINFLNSFLRKNKINQTISKIEKKHIYVQSASLHLSMPGDNHHEQFLKDCKVTNQFVNLHYDPKKVYKIIIYLNEVGIDNGPLKIIPYSIIEKDEVEDFFSRVTSVGNYCQNPSQRRFVMRMPKKIRVSSNFGRLLNDSDQEEINSHLINLTSEMGNTHIFNAGNLVHMGGLVKKGCRIAIQIKLS